MITGRQRPPQTVAFTFVVGDAGAIPGVVRVTARDRATGTLLIALVLVATLLAAVTHASAACKSTCTEELRACREQCRGSTDRRGCRQRCADASTCGTPGTGLKLTGAYPIVECRNDAAGFSIRERLVVRRGNCDAVTVMELPPVGPVFDPVPLLLPQFLGACDAYAQYRLGFGSVIVGRFQRIAVTPDAKYVVVEVTNDHVLRGLEALSPEPPEEGILRISTKDGHVERLGPPSARPIVTLNDLFQPVLAGSPFMGISPDSRFLAYEDRGPDPDGLDADQIAVIDMKTDPPQRRLVTQLRQAADGALRTGNSVFVNDRTIFFYDGADGIRATVRVDGSGLRLVPNPANADGRVVLDFGIFGGLGNALGGRRRDQTPVIDYHNGDHPPVRELFYIKGSRELQLTGFRYPDTGGAVRPQVARDRVLFVASADPRPSTDRREGNPKGVCQLFSIDTLGSHLRQVTHFPPDAGEQHGCGVPGPGHACDVTGFSVDQRTGAIVMASSCDPLGRNPNGEQFFTMRADGSGLRQISAFRGVERSDDVVQVEMAGPPAASLLIR
jgi:hypothetical protein